MNMKGKEMTKECCTYPKYWNYINFIVNNSYDLEDLREAITHQKIIPDSVILENHTQHPCYTPDTALYLDALKLFKEKQRTPQL